MDIEFLKSIPEDQIEMMMQLDKLPDFCGIYSDDFSNDTPSMEFSHDGSPSNYSSHHQILENPDHVAANSSSTFFNMPSNISFTGSGGGEMSFFSNSGNGTRWRSGGNTGDDNIPTPEQKRNINSMAAMREMIFRIAAMQPIHIDPESVKPPKRRNVKISKDPQSVAARHRRERISEKIRILQRLVPGGTKMDTASMLDEAIHYVKFLKNQVQTLERAAANRPPGTAAGIGFLVPMTSGSYMAMGTKGYNQAAQSVQHYLDA